MIPQEFSDTGTYGCDICGKVKKVCCAYWGKGRYCYCKECCPKKADHIRDNRLREKEIVIVEKPITLEEVRDQLLEIKKEIEQIKYRMDYNMIGHSDE